MSSSTTASIVWTRLLGTTSNDNATAIAVGSDGYVYLAGNTQGNLDGQVVTGGTDGFISKYSADGSRIWTQLITSTNNLSLGESANGIAIASDGAIYIVGSVSGPTDGQGHSGDFDAFITKLSADGTRAWTRLVGSSSAEFGAAITIGLDGSIYIAGTTSGAGSLDGVARNLSSYSDAFVTKFSSDGTKVWTRLISSEGFDQAYALTTGSDGFIYVAGGTDGSLGGQTNSGGGDAFLTKVAADGSLIWTRTLGTGDSVYATALTNASDGSVYVAGHARGNLDGLSSNGSYDAFIANYNSNGVKAWTRTLGASAGDGAYGLATASDGSIFVAGLANGVLDGQASAGNNDVFVARYNADGTKVWTKQFGSSNHDQANAVFAGSSGAIYVAGSAGGNLNGETGFGSWSSSDAFAVKLSQTTTTNNASQSSSSASANPLPICFLKGTQVRLTSCETRVESLTLNQALESTKEQAQVKWIGYQRRTPEFAQFDDYLPVKICAGALEENVPVRDLYLSPDHAVLVDGHLIHAQALVNGRTIIKMTEWEGDIEYYHIETENHEIIFAEGVPCETFIDNVSREQFDNYAEYQALYPYTQMMRELPLPRVKFRRQMPSAIWRRLMERADLITAAQNQA